MIVAITAFERFLIFRQDGTLCFIKLSCYPFNEYAERRNRHQSEECANEVLLRLLVGEFSLQISILLWSTVLRGNRLFDQIKVSQNRIKTGDRN